MPRAQLADEPDSMLLTPRKKAKQAALVSRFKIDEHFLSARCLTCGAPTDEESGAPSAASGARLLLTLHTALCDLCCMDPQGTMGKLLARVHRTEKRLQNVHRVCASCSSISAAEPVQCVSLDCPWLFERRKLENKAQSMNATQDLVDDLLQLHVDGSHSDQVSLYSRCIHALFC